MRLKVAEAYVKVLSGGHNGGGKEKPSNSQIGLNAVVNGLGPMFQMVIQVRTSTVTQTQASLIRLEI